MLIVYMHIDDVFMRMSKGAHIDSPTCVWAVPQYWLLVMVVVTRARDPWAVPLTW